MLSSIIFDSGTASFRSCTSFIRTCAAAPSFPSAGVVRVSRDGPVWRAGGRRWRKGGGGGGACLGATVQRGLSHFLMPNSGRCRGCRARLCTGYPPGENLLKRESFQKSDGHLSADLVMQNAHFTSETMAPSSRNPKNTCWKINHVFANKKLVHSLTALQRLYNHPTPNT